MRCATSNKIERKVLGTIPACVNVHVHSMLMAVSRRSMDINMAVINNNMVHARETLASRTRACRRSKNSKIGFLI